MNKKYLNRCVNLLSGQDRIEQPQNIINEARTEATIYIYDEISWWWLGAEWFVNEINALKDVPEIHVRVNSPGGDYFEAMAMQTAMAQHPANFIVHIDGLAASAASFFIRGANKRVMSKGAFIMTHRAAGGIFGTGKAVISRGEALLKIDEAIIEGNVRAAGVDNETATEWVDNETWFSAEEALKHGFVNEVIEAEPVENTFDLSSVYNNVPDSIVNVKPEPEPEPEPKDPEPDGEQWQELLAKNQKELELLELA